MVLAVSILPRWAVPRVPTGPFFVAIAGVKIVPILRTDAPNLHYADLDRDACMAELDRRQLPFATAIGEATADVLAPVRLRGPLHGVAIHSDRNAHARSIYEILDCRLVLALDDFAQLVAVHHVTELVFHYAYRPRTEYGCTKRYLGLQHCGALAIDIHAFKRADGTTLSVERDFHGRIGLATCVDGVGPTRYTRDAGELWAIACGAAEQALFNVVLTPNFNAEHHNHFHLELTPGAWWMMVH